MDTKQDGITIVEAASWLGVTPETVRKRLQRGVLPGCKIDGQWVVQLPKQEQDTGRPAPPTEQETNQTPQPTKQDAKPGTSRTEQDARQDTPHPAYERLLARLESENGFLRDELTARTEELRRKDHIIAALTDALKQRLPELEPGTPATPPPRQPTQQERSWWHRFFGWL